MSETKDTSMPWGWQKFGDEWCLTAQHGMRAIILAVRKGKLTSLVDGLLVPFDPKHPHAQFIIDACNQHDRLTADRDALLGAVKEIGNRAKRIREDRAIVGTEAFYIEQITRAAIAKVERE
jgi:hypothetical protein